MSGKKRSRIFRNIFRFRLFSFLQTTNRKKVYRKYVHKLHEASGRKASMLTGYVKRTEYPLDSRKLDVRTIAFYLPQFHPIPENDLWWGKGFTEWSNVTRAVPQFVGHYQPRLPGDLGFYDLRLPDVMRQQAEIARDYGIHGFCFHHYWFAGQRLLERPVQDLLRNPEIDINFCLCWANENWSRRWDGSENDILMAQAHSPEDDIAFIDDLIPSFKDPRYIRVDGKPLLIVYRATLFPDIRATAQRWRERVKEYGIEDLYLVAAKSFDVGDPTLFGFDAAVEFPPHQVGASLKSKDFQIVNPGFKGKISDYRKFAEKAAKHDPKEYICHKTVMPSWDNTARKLGAGHTFVNSTPLAYADWLGKALDITMTRPEQERLLFINAWNEWGEGAYLEPDRLYGYAYLNATAGVLSRTYHDEETGAYIAEHNRQVKKTSDTAVVLHLYYEDLLDELLQTYLSRMMAADFFISVRHNASLVLLEKIAQLIPNAYLIKTQHRGRDMLPFLTAFERLSELGYEHACKIHTKKSPHLEDGGAWRNRLVGSIMGGRDPLAVVRDIFANHPETGILVPRESVLSLSVKYNHVENTTWLNLLLDRIGGSRFIGKYEFKFQAGSMFWFRVEALRGLSDLGISAKDFADESGQLDGTLAHALERLILLIASERGFQYREIDLGKEPESTFLSGPKHP